MIGVGQKVGSCEVLQLLGRGGIGDVYAGIDRTLERRVAIKALRPEFGQEPGFIVRFRAEARNLAQLNHPNIATLYSLHVDDRALCMIMEFVPGRTLEEIIVAAGRLNERDSLALIAQASEGLSCAHRGGIVHRDVKPANMMVTAGGVLKITDFGIALMRGAKRLTQQGRIVGTVAYMAPEQILGGTPDERTDIYSLAIVLYELLCGSTPFVSDSEYELLRMQVETLPPRLMERVHGLSPRVEQAVMQALSKRPAERFQTMEEFAHALGAAELRATAVEIVRARVSGLIGETSEPFTADAQGMTRVADDQGRETRQISPRETQDLGSTRVVRADETPSPHHTMAARHPDYDPRAVAHRPSRRIPALVLAAAGLLFVSGAGYLAWDFFGDDRQQRVAGGSAPRAPGKAPSEILDPERLADVASRASPRTEAPTRPMGSPDSGDQGQGAGASPDQAEGDESAPVVSTTIITQEPQTAMVKPAPSPFAAAPSRTMTKGGVFQDCSVCPPMIEVPAGSFQMGNRGQDSTEQPVHEVALKHRFAIGVREVTYGEWMACVKDQGCKHAPELVSTTDQSPMRDVSWSDAVQYTAWLKKTTQQPYRLPTEAEWEYAARANSSTHYWWGNDPGVVYANCKGCGGEWNRDAPLKVGSYRPNPFGIYDMNGSVWEWVSDCWHSNYKGAPNDGRSWETPGCQQRVLRGGSWRDDPSLVRSFTRFYYDADIRYIANGFRVALTLD
jgi:formylglycine-generating enzyme required for sulfatase activity